MSLQGFLERTPFISRSLLVKMGCILKDFFSLIIQPSLFQRVLWHMFIIFVWLHFLWLKRSPICREDTYALFLFLEIEGILKTWLMEHVRNANFLALPQTYWITSSGCGVSLLIWFHKPSRWLWSPLKAKSLRANISLSDLFSPPGWVCGPSLWVLTSGASYINGEGKADSLRASGQTRKL